MKGSEMNLRLKTFGLALITMLILGVLSAPGASATAKQFHAEQNVILTGEETSEIQFTIPGTGETTCETIDYNATGGTTQTEVTASADFTGCTFGGLPAHAIINECKAQFTLHTGTTSTGGTTTHTHGPVHLSCPQGKEGELTVTFFGFSICTILLPPQTPTSPTADYKNKGTGNKRDVEVTSTVQGVTMVTTDEGGCEEGIHHNAEINGAVTVRGYKSGQAHTEANQVGIWEE